DDWVLGDFIEVVGIIGSVLITPFDRPVRGIDSEHAPGPFVVARPVFGVPVRSWIADALVERVAFGIVGRSLPHRAAAVSPPFLAVLPGLTARLTRARDRVGAPRRLAGVEVGRLDEATNAPFPTCGAHDGEVADDQRRDGESLTDRRLGDLALPGDFAGRL